MHPRVHTARIGYWLAGVRFVAELAPGGRQLANSQSELCARVDAFRMRPHDTQYPCCGACSGHVFWTFEIHSRSGRCSPRVGPDGQIIAFMDKPFNQLRFFTYCLHPFVVILVLNVLIVARLRWTPRTLKPTFAGSNPAVSFAGLAGEASSVGMTTAAADGGVAGSSSRMMMSTNTSASASASALRHRQQVRTHARATQSYIADLAPVP